MVVIITDRYGRLGNRLIRYSHFIANAAEHDYYVINFPFGEYANYFREGNVLQSCIYPSRNQLITNHILFEKIFVKVIYKFFKLLRNYLIKLNLTNSKFHTIIQLNDDEQYELNDNKYLAVVKTKKIVFIQGWLFRDSTNITKHYKEIISFFNPTKEHNISIENLISSIRKKCDILVGVHIRRGDYKDFNGGKFYYDHDIYSKMMRLLSNLFSGKKVHFLICSNEPLVAKFFSDFEFSFGLNHELEDMYSLSKCDYLIGPPSTYTMWASFYGKVPLYMMNSIKENDMSLDDFEIITSMIQAP